MRKLNLCRTCGADISDRHWKTQFCTPCYAARARAAARSRRPVVVPGQREAHAAVAKAVRKGILSRPDECKCADCGRRAAHYDHRDYNKPLDVQAVCIPCNIRRGPAIPLRSAA